MEPIVRSIAREVGRLDGLVAFAVGGSSTRQVAGTDAASDIDLYVFVQRPLEREAREALIAALGVSERQDLGVDYWGASDQWVDPGSGRHIDLMYFEAPWMRQEIEGVLDQHRVRLGYTTSFCYTMAHATSILDPHGWLAKMRSKCREPYPEVLREKIIAANHRAIRGILSSYEAQIRKAAARGDLVSLNHRVAALVASYFDILFAVNRQLHPGEKRLIALAKDLCPRRPEGMEGGLTAVLTAAASAAEVMRPVTRLLDRLDEFVGAFA
jgi:Domain of unknown function (DUF4037)